MYKENLTKADRELIKEEIRQFLSISLLASMSVTIIVVAIYVIFSKTEYEFLKQNKNLIIGIFASVFILSLLIYFWVKARKLTYDLIKGIKFITPGIITDKKININYGYSLGGWLQSQPRLEGYFLFVDHMPYWVNKNTYEAFDIGTKVRLHLAYESNILLKITEHP